MRVYSTFWREHWSGVRRTLAPAPLVIGCQYLLQLLVVSDQTGIGTQAVECLLSGF